MFEYRAVYFDSPPQVGRAMDIFEHESPEAPSVFFVHGGGWKAGSRTTFHPLMTALLREGLSSASTDYRLRAGGIKNQIDDVQTGLRIFCEDRRQRGCNPAVVIHASSAGAHLALLAVMSLPSGNANWLKQIKGLALQAAPLTFEPWLDEFPAIRSCMTEIVGVPYEANPDLYRDLSPIHNLHPQVPPIFLMHAENEHMFPLFLSEEFQREAEACGVAVKLKIYPRTEHGFLYSLERWQQKEAFADLVTFTREATANS